MFRQDCTCPALLEDSDEALSHTGLSPAAARRSRRFWLRILEATGLVRFRSPLLAESRLMSFPPATEMFQFAGFASRTYEFSPGYSLLSGLPHSEIQGSTIARISPWLFAACHVLHRLSVPRHPPDALTSTLDRKTRRLQGQAPRAQPVSHEDTQRRCSAVSHRQSADSPAASVPTHSLFTCQRSIARQANPPEFRPSRSPPRRPRKADGSGAPALVEVNGIEPSTSCLQSRRSPN